jgi:anti-sigma regulatory factor (Ser/Thr protein kinase)
MPTAARRRRSTEKPPSLHLSVPPVAEHARTVREALIAFSVLHGVAPLDLEALLFAVGEALANAVEHAHSRGDIEIFASLDDAELMATVVDYGRGFSIVPNEVRALPDGLCERGRGIPIMQRFVDAVSVESIPDGGTTVTLRRRRREGLAQVGA